MTLTQDLIYAARSLRKAPGLVAVVVLTLALGIGENTTVFNVLNLMLLAPPTAVEPDRLVRIEPGNGNQISYLNFRDMAGSSAFADMALTTGASLNWRNGDAVEPVPAMALSANYFQLLGAHAWFGRTFISEASAPEVVVLSYEFWQRRFASERGIIGRSVNLNGRPFMVIGVMARGYRAGMGSLIPQMFVPISPAVSDVLEDRRSAAFSVVARLAPGMGREQAQAAFTSMAQALEKAYPKENRSLGREAFVAPLSGLASLRERNSRP
jgi:hypothetical protein